MKVGYISNQLVNDAETIFCGKEIEWYFIEKTTKNEDGHTCIFEAPSFTHMIYTPQKESRFLELTFLILESVLDEIGEYILDDITQIRVNLMTRQVESKGKHTYPHKDPTDDMVLIYYVNDSDGPTHIFTEGIIHKIEPKKGKFVLFENDFHAAAFPVEHDTRVIINYNIKLKKRSLEPIPES